EKKGEVQQYIIEAYEAKQTIKNFHREDNFIKGFINVSAQELSLFFKAHLGYAFIGPYIKLGLGASLLWASLLIKARGGGTPDLVFFSGFLYLFLEPVSFMSWVAVVMSQGLAAWKRVKELHGAVITPATAAVNMEQAPFEETAMELRTTADFWEHKLDLVVKKGQWTVLVGETGVGKSHLLSSLATTMILKGHKVSMVQQEPYLFNDTIEENIFLGQTPSELDR